MLNKITKQKIKEYIKKYIIFTLALIFSAIVYNVFIRPAHIVTGGTGGIALITEKLFGISPSLMIFLVCFLLLIFSYIFLGIEETLAALYVSLIYPIFIQLTTNFSEFFPFTEREFLLYAVIGGVLCGIADGILLRTGLNTGGTGIIGKIFFKHKKVAIRKVSSIVSMIVIICGGFVFGIETILYAFIYLYILEFVCEKVLLGVSKNKLFYIISIKEHNKIKKFIIEELGHDVTIFNTTGKYFDEKQKVIMVAIPTREYSILKEAVIELDEECFITVTDGYEVSNQDLNLPGVK